jgi:hypothetical protein
VPLTALFGDRLPAYTATRSRVPVSARTTTVVSTGTARALLGLARLASNGSGAGCWAGSLPPLPASAGASGASADDVPDVQDASASSMHALVTSPAARRRESALSIEIPPRRVVGPV